jgi:zinc transport system substrate-binding protein
MRNIALSGITRGSCLILLAVFCTSCAKESPVDLAFKNESIEIIAVNYPLFYFTTQLTADWAVVTYPVPADIDPAQWRPGVEEIQAMQQADMVVLNGAGYSAWLDKVALSPSKLTDSTAQATSQLIELKQQATHSHGPRGEHSHSGFAFTTWMDIELAKQQVNAIAKALGDRWPEHRPTIQTNEAALLDNLTGLDSGYLEQADRLAGRTLIYSHPVYQYFERRYQLSGHSLHWEPDETPSEKQWSELQALMTHLDHGLFIWEDVPAPTMLQRMSEMGLESVVIRPAANRGKSDWLTEQQSNLQRLAACCQEVTEL